MVYKCKNCGGNVLYNPKSGRMVCDSCGGEDSEEILKPEDPFTCPSCGSHIEVGEYDSSCKCEACGAPIILDPRIEYPYGPDLALPFMIDKYEAIEALRAYAKDKLFIPGNFINAHMEDKLEGIYVPFWLYDFDTDVHYNAIGVKIRTWTSGDTEYTETSKYAVARELEIDYSGYPADASIKMPDDMMDLVEPYDYGRMGKFDAKLLSGFSAERYNFDPNQLEPRVKARMAKDTDAWINSTISGYNHMEGVQKRVDDKRKATNFALLPVWDYKYHYKGQEYHFYLNGQSGKIVGKSPVSPARVFGLTATLFTTLAIFIQGLEQLLEML